MNSQRTLDIPERKIKAVSDLKKLIKENRTIMIASISGLPASQFQEIGKKLRGKAVVKVPKKNLIFRAIDESSNKEVSKLKDEIKSSVALLFSNQESYDLAGDLLKSKSPAKAKAGQIAPQDIEIEAGPTELLPGPAITELGSVGLQVKIEKGKIHIKESKVIVKEGEVIKENAADVMNKLGIKPFYVGFIPLVSFDTKENILYTEIKIDKEEALMNLKEAYGKALAFALERGYFSEETIGLMISKAVSHERKLIRIITGEPEPITESQVEEKIESPKEEKKEEPAADAGAGLASLFG